MEIGDDFPIPPPPPHDPHERQNRWRDSSDSSTESYSHAHPSTLGGSPTVPKVGDVHRVAPQSRDLTHFDLTHDPTEEQRPREGIMIRKCHVARPPRTLPMLDKGKGKATSGSASSLPEVVPPSPHSMEALMKD